MRLRIASLGLFTLLCSMSVAGCQYVFGFDYKIVDDTTQTGTTTQGGGGTITTSTQGGGGDTSTAGVGGTTTTTSAPCMNDIQDGTETDIDCGGLECAKCELGKKCLTAGDCATSFCADGVCCDTACTDSCIACSAMKKGQGADGLCDAVKLGPEPDGACPAGNSCDGSGTCKPANGQVCAGDSDCASGHCADGVCCDEACTGTCRSCVVPMKEGTCTPTPAGYDYDGECNGTAPADNCNGVTGCGLGVIGATCLAAMPGACETGNCSDGYCCDDPCTGQICRACRGDYTGLPNGVCAAVTFGTDPKDECPDPRYCIANDVCSQ